MFKQRLNELRQRQLEIRLRDMELRAELRAETGRLIRPITGMAWLGGALGAVGLVAGLRMGRGRGVLSWVRLGLRLLRLRFSASSSAAPSSSSSHPPSGQPPSPNP